jgi:hypothetical protein
MVGGRLSVVEVVTVKVIVVGCVVVGGVWCVVVSGS